MHFPGVVSVFMGGRKPAAAFSMVLLTRFYVMGTGRILLDIFN